MFKKLSSSENIVLRKYFEHGSFWLNIFSVVVLVSNLDDKIDGGKLNGRINEGAEKDPSMCRSNKV